MLMLKWFCLLISLCLGGVSSRSASWSRKSLSFIAPTRSVRQTQSITQFAVSAMGARIESSNEMENEFSIEIDGPTSKNGKFGKVVYDKILKDQKQLAIRQPIQGFRPGVLPPFMLPRVLYASVSELCKEICKAALDEQGIKPSENQDVIELEFPGISNGDIPAFCKATSYKPGDDLTFKARRVKGSKAGEIFPAQKD